MRYLICGNKGQLGKEFEKKLSKMNKKFIGFDIDTTDIGDIDALSIIFEQFKPTVVLNCAAYNNVDGAETESQQAFRVNADGVHNLAKLSENYGAFLVHYSSDYVFDGLKANGLYTEGDRPHPINQYGRSKLEGENLLAEYNDRALILRLSWVFGEGTQNFIHKLQNWAENNDMLNIVCDETSVPTYTGTITEVTLSALEHGLSGIYHLTNSGYATRYEWAKLIFKILGIKKFIYPAHLSDFVLPARRPRFSAMSNSKLVEEMAIKIPEWEEATEKFLKEIK